MHHESYEFSPGYRNPDVGSALPTFTCLPFHYNHIEDAICHAHRINESSFGAVFMSIVGIPKTFYEPVLMFNQDICGTTQLSDVVAICNTVLSSYPDPLYLLTTLFQQRTCPALRSFTCEDPVWTKCVRMYATHFEETYTSMEEELIQMLNTLNNF